MAVKDNYSRARATKKSSSVQVNTNVSKRSSKKAVNTIKKSPILMLVFICLIIGVAGGFLAFKTFSTFEMNTFIINGVASAEVDYIVIDMTKIKEEFLKIDEDATMDEIYTSISLKDNLTTCKFFGADITDTVKIKYYYREDISQDAQETDKIDVKTPGVYYIEYTSSHFAFKNKTLIRTIIVTGVENNG